MESLELSAYICDSGLNIYIDVYLWDAVTSLKWTWNKTTSPCCRATCDQKVR